MAHVPRHAGYRAPTQGQIHYNNLAKKAPLYRGTTLQRRARENAFYNSKEMKAAREYRDKGKAEYDAQAKLAFDARAALEDTSENRTARQIQEGIDAVDFLDDFDSVAGLTQAGIDYMNFTATPRDGRNYNRGRGVGLGAPGADYFGRPPKFRTKLQKAKDYNKTVEQKNAMNALRKDMSPLFQEQSRQFLSRRATRGATNILSGQPTSQSIRPRVPTINSAATGTTLIRT
ncbi:MAG: hypothetical protein NZ777_16490 [Pseudomonadales bacterium]|nr:hypothetical protein [Pseudomonadales bacterium]